MEVESEFPRRIKEINNHIQEQSRWPVFPGISGHFIIWWTNSDSRYGFVDTEMNVVIKPEFKKALSFVNGEAWVFVSGKWGRIDRNGNWTIEPRKIFQPQEVEGSEFFISNN